MNDGTGRYLESGAFFRVYGSERRDAGVCLFLHRGPGHNSYDLETLVAPELARHISVVVMDQQGAGRSRSLPPEVRVTWESLLGDIEAVKQVLAIERISILGHSFGGCLAYRYAARWPEHVGALIVCNQGIGPRRIVSSFLERLPNYLHEPAQKREVSRLNAEPGLNLTERFRAIASIVRLSDVFKTQQYCSTMECERHQVLEAQSGLRTSARVQDDMLVDGLLERDYEHELRKVRSRALVVAGRTDCMPLASEVEEMGGLIDEAQVMVFQASGHFPYLEEPQQFLRSVLSFLRDSGQ